MKVQAHLVFRYKEVDAPENAEYDAVIGALNTKLLSLADCDADLRVVDVAASAMQLEEGTSDPAMQNADGVLVEAQGHGYVRYWDCSMKSVGVWRHWQWDLQRGLD